MNFYIAIIDFNMGNLKSVSKILQYLNVQYLITSNQKDIANANIVILPGVGAFKDAIKNLKKMKLIEVLNEIVSNGTLLFGICLGLQLFFKKSFENGKHDGLNIIEGKVVPFDIDKVKKVPHVGWNNVNFTNSNHYLFNEIPNNAYFYFVHSYYAIPEKKELIIGTTQYEKTEFASIVMKNNVIATQFHPEKSGKNGIQIFKNIIEHWKK